MARMTSAFCCTSLLKGTLIIGWVHLVLALVLLAIGGTVLEVLDQLIQNKRTSMTEQDMETYRAVTLAVSIVLYGGLTLCIIINICLLYGANKGRRAFLMPYMIFAVMGIALSSLHLLSDVVNGIHKVKPVVLRLVSIPISIYCLCIVASYYVELHPANQTAKDQSTVTVQYPGNQTSYGLPPTNQYIPVQQKQEPFSAAPEKEFLQMA